MTRAPIERASDRELEVLPLGRATGDGEREGIRRRRIPELKKCLVTIMALSAHRRKKTRGFRPAQSWLAAPPMPAPPAKPYDQPLEICRPPYSAPSDIRQ